MQGAEIKNITEESWDSESESDSEDKLTFVTRSTWGSNAGRGENC